MIRGRDIIMIGIQPWNFSIGSNAKNIALEFAKHNRVLYVNTPVNRKTFMAPSDDVALQEHIHIIRKKLQPVSREGENIWQLYPPSVIESINWLPSTRAFQWANRLNNRKLAADICTAASGLGFKNVILFNDNDFFNGLHMKHLLKPACYIYYCRDYLRGFSYWKKHGDAVEPLMIRNADAAVANSEYLADYCREHNPNSFYIGQGCNLKLFNPEIIHPLPEEMKGLKGPVIGYVGNITSERLDPAIVEVIARHNPGWNVVMVGPQDEVFAESRLHDLPNVIFTGRKKLDQLPAYVQHFNVCINPQFLNQATIGNYPLKVDEYLAMGKPVVATHTRTMEAFAEHVYLAGSPAEYPGLVERALEYNCPERATARKAFAAGHTWENSVGKIYEVIGKVEEKEAVLR